MEQIFLISLVLFAILAVQASALRRAVIYLSAYSLLSSVVFLIYGAPDVALAEAIIGCGLSVVFFLVALKRQRLITIYLVNERYFDAEHKRELGKLLHAIERLYAHKELQSHIIRTELDKESILTRYDFDLLVCVDHSGVTFFGGADDYQVDTLATFLEKSDKMAFPVALQRINKGREGT